LGSQPCSGNKRCADGQAVEQQVEGRRLVLADLRRLQQVEEIEAPVSAEDVGVAPDQDHGTGDEQAPAEELILQEARQGEVLLSGRGPAPEQVSDERQLHRRGGGKPQQVHGRQHDHLRRFDEQQHAEQLHRRELLAGHAIERQQHAEQRREQDEQHAHAVGRGMVGEHIEAFGKLQDIAGRHIDAGVEVDRHDQFGDRKQAAEDQRQVEPRA
jgi:hypothetical protein